MNIIEQLQEMKRRMNKQKALQSAARDGIKVTHHRGWKRKALRYWCPDCQQWVQDRAGFACCQCFKYLPQKQAEWDERVKRSNTACT